MNNWDARALAPDAANLNQPPEPVPPGGITDVGRTARSGGGVAAVEIDTLPSSKAMDRTAKLLADRSDMTYTSKRISTRQRTGCCCGLLPLQLGESSACPNRAPTSSSLP